MAARRTGKNNTLQSFIGKPDYANSDPNTVRSVTGTDDVGEVDDKKNWFDDNSRVTIEPEDGDAADAVDRSDSDPDGYTITDDGSGNLTIEASGHEDENKKKLSPSDHDANLAEFLTDQELALMSLDINQMIEADEKSRADWVNFLARGLEILGVQKPTTKSPFPNSNEITHPMMAEALVQFNARAMQELLPPTGPVKTEIIGDQDDEIIKKAADVQDFMNWQLTTQDKNYYEESDQLFFILPLEASCFRKVYWDNVRQMTTSRLVRAKDILIPYIATSVYDSPRITHIMQKTHNEVLRMIRAGDYRDVDLPIPQDEGTNTFYGRDVQDQIDNIDNKDPSYAEEDYRHTIFEVHIEYNVSIDDDDSGIACPYIITIERDSGKILSVRRNWDEEDKARLPNNWFIQYKYLPGPGVYGFGMLHVIGGFAEACTGSIRALLDSASFATLQGGFKSKDARLPSNISIRPGEWVDVDLTAEEMQKCFYTPPFKEPSQALFELLNLMQENGRRFAGTVDAMVGEAPTNGPVGTIVAIIEQASKVMSGVHRRLHRSQGAEFELRMKINKQYIPDQGVSFMTKAKGKRVITPKDFDERIMIIPVSDPNIVSTSQKIAIDQSMLQLSTQNPNMYRIIKLHKRLLKDMGVENVEEYIIDPADTPRMDPFSEYAMVLGGLPIRAFVDQNHPSHIAVHQAHIQMLTQQLAQTKDLKQQQMLNMQIGSLMEHIAKHMGYQAFVDQQKQSGIKLPMINLYAFQDGGKPVPMDTATEDKISQMQAMFITNLLKTQAAQQQAAAQQAQVAKKIQSRQTSQAAAQQVPAQDKNGQTQAMKDQLDMAEKMKESKRKDAKTQTDIALKTASTKADIKRKDAVAASKIKQDHGAAEADHRRKNVKVISDIARGNVDQAHSQTMDKAKALIGAAQTAKQQEMEAQNNDDSTENE